MGNRILIRKDDKDEIFDGMSEQELFADGLMDEKIQSRSWSEITPEFQQSLGHEKKHILDAIYKISQSYTEATVRNALKNISGKETYIDNVIRFLELVSDREQLLIKVFFDDFMEDKDYLSFLPEKIMEYVGLSDLLVLDLQKSASTKIGIPFQTPQELFIRSQSDNPLLIIGETGTSKELLAKAIHLMSKRRLKEYIKINCAAIAENLIESELFGYVKGAFTGAKQDKIGFLKRADGGTMLLDELGKMPMPLQGKLLRVIEEKIYYPVGSTKSNPANVKIIAAAQPNNIKNGTILEDLLYRMGYPDVIEMPTLNDRLRKSNPLERPHIIINSALRTLDKMSGVHLPETMSIDTDCLPLLFKHEFKGNYRELENILCNAIRSAMVNQRDVILPEDIRLIDSGKIHPDNSLTDYLSKFNKIKLKDIFDYADEFREFIIDKKRELTTSDGKNLKSILLGEGLPEKEYQNAWKKFDSIKKKRAQMK